jgi:MFS superfamily sulfate permease-like transporter
VLAAIVFMIGIKLIDVKGMRELWQLQRNEFWIALVTAATVVVFTVMAGIGVAVLLSLIEHVRHTYRPRVLVLVRDKGGHWHEIPATPDKLAAPGILVYRFEANLFYANSSLFMERILALISAGKEPVRAVVFDASSIDDVDYTAAKMLLQLRDELAKRSVEVVIVTPHDSMLEELQRYGLFTEGGRIYPSVDAAMAALGASRA